MNPNITHHSDAVVQDLSKFELPPGFRGRSAFIVQLWWIIRSVFFHASPQFCYSWRNFWLRRFGAKIGRNVLIRPSVRITYPWKLMIGDNSWIGDSVELYNLAPIIVGKNSVVSQGSYLCTGSHYFSDPSFGIYARSIIVEDQAWICAGVFVHPGVTIGFGSVVAARAVVNRSTSRLMVYGGSPAVAIKRRQMPSDAKSGDG